jgi:hypothetical protein
MRWLETWLFYRFPRVPGWVIDAISMVVFSLVVLGIWWAVLLFVVAKFGI